MDLNFEEKPVMENHFKPLSKVNRYWRGRLSAVMQNPGKSSDLGEWGRSEPMAKEKGTISNCTIPLSEL